MVSNEVWERPIYFVWERPIDPPLVRIMVVRAPAQMTNKGRKAEMELVGVTEP